MSSELCPNCQRDMNGSSVCPYCGWEPPTPKSTVRVFFLSIVLIFFGAIGACSTVAAFTPVNSGVPFQELAAIVAVFSLGIAIACGVAIWRIFH